MMMVQTIREIIDATFSTTSNDMDVIRQLEHEADQIQRRIDTRRKDLQAQVAVLLCLSAIDVRMHGGRLNKVPLIRVYRTAYKSSLRDAKDFVEAYILVDEDIPF